MTEPRDEIDNWLRHEVEPLAPPPGTFERVHRRAGRRKLNQALLASAGAVVVIAGAALLPPLGSGLFHGPGSPRPPAASSPSQRTVTVTPKASSSAPAVSPSSSGAPPLSSTGLSGSTSGAAVPPHFRPTSVTMIGHDVGAVIGQAGPPCATADCTSLAGTSTYGASWYGVSAPKTSGPDGSQGVSQLRFLDLRHGWAYGPELWETSDGGHSWTSVPTGGQRVTDLETAGHRVFVVLARCRGTGADYTAGCSAFSLYSAALGATTLQQVTLPAGLASSALSSGSQGSSASLVIGGAVARAPGRSAYLLTPSSDIFEGAVSGGPWRYVGRVPCPPGAAAASGAPMGAQLTTSGSALLLNCSGSGSGSRSGGDQPKELWESSDGSSWTRVSQPPAAGPATSLASGSAGRAVLATTAGIDYWAGGTTWQQATIGGGVPARGFSYVGMTSATQGVALPANAGLGEVFITKDGGQTWTASPVSG